MQTTMIDLGEVALSVASSRPDADAGRPLLLVHGFTGSKDDFTPWLDDLAALGFWAVAPDLRGHGDSDKPAAPDRYSLDLFADDVEALLGQLGWERAAVLGHSMGGMVVQTALLRDPSWAEALVLMDTSHGPIPGIDRSMLPLAIDVIEQQGMDGLVAVMKELGGGVETPAGQELRRRDPAYDAHCWEVLAKTSGAMWRAMAPALLDQDDRLDRLGVLAMPTLVIVGDQDEAFIPDSRRMAEALPDARLVVVPDAGHCPQFEHTAPWWEAVSGFLVDATAPTPA